MQATRHFPVAKAIRYGPAKVSSRHLLCVSQHRSPIRPLSTRPRFSSLGALGPHAVPNTPGNFVAGNNFHRPYSLAQPSNAVDTTAPQEHVSASGKKLSRVSIPVDGEMVEFSTVLLRDSCSCPLCVHESTRQRLFASANIPADINARAVEIDSASDSVNITWEKDAQGYGKDHTTNLSMDSLRSMMHSGYAPGSLKDSFKPPALWTKEPLNLPDYDYATYMKDDKLLYQLITQLRTEGLAFVTNIPGLETSLATIATRIGPVMDTFYGHTWDVRTVPAAINAAYTSHDLGFHTDLLYFQHPPHVQLLHCIQSASKGGASVFADAFKAAVDLFHTDMDAFDTLAMVPVNYHYNHPDSNVYHTTKPVIDLRPLRVENTIYTRFQDYLGAMESRGAAHAGPGWQTALLIKSLEKINWGPPFQAPFSHSEDAMDEGQSTLSALNDKVDQWHRAASKFNGLLQRSEYLYERKMNPGDCVLFDNTRTLHSRRAFNMADADKPRWLRGTYVDKDSYFSKLRVLQNKFR